MLVFSEEKMLPFTVITEKHGTVFCKFQSCRRGVSCKTWSCLARPCFKLTSGTSFIPEKGRGEITMNSNRKKTKKEEEVALTLEIICRYKPVQNCCVD